MPHRRSGRLPWGSTALKSSMRHIATSSCRMRPCPCNAYVGFDAHHRRNDDPHCVDAQHTPLIPAVRHGPPCGPCAMMRNTLLRPMRTIATSLNDAIKIVRKKSVALPLRAIAAPCNLPRPARKQHLVVITARSNVYPGVPRATGRQGG